MPPKELPKPESPPRIEPLPPEQATGAAREFFDFIESPEGLPGASAFNVVRTLAQHPELARRYLNFGLHIRRFSTLPVRLRELATLRTAWLYEATYEWERHVLSALRGQHVTKDEVEALKAGPDSPVWTPFERDMLRAVDQLRSETRIGDGLWSSLSSQFDDRQMLDFVFTVGSYAMLAMVLNAVRVQIDVD